ncbi:MAG: L,D-transpeptidase/peptidoglycan binding protein [Solirubrobacteraceae bacterium]|nr:L,D-transpeptidase/peptidoglycan binding protein [Solirubrobacteraceae bacterium]
MRRRVLISGVLAGAIVASGGVVVGLSAASSGKIADGIRVGAVELGGLSPEQAKARLDREYVEPLKQPIVVERRGKRYQLGPKEARLTANLDETVAKAVEASEEGNALTNAWRTATGTHAEKNFTVDVSASDAAITRFIDRIRRGVDRDAIDASLTFDHDRPVLSESKTGMAVDRRKLRSLVNAELTNADRSTILAPVKTTQPKQSAAKIRKEHGTIITVDRITNELRLYKNFKLSKKYSVAVGSQGHETPAGTYTINDKQVNPSWHVPMSDWAGSLAGTVVPPGPSNPIRARWMGFFDGAGIHGTSDRGSIGSNASHGCVRMLEEDVIDLYDRVPVGATINVV